MEGRKEENWGKIYIYMIRTIGKPLQQRTSVWQRLAKSILTLTSPAFGVSTSISSTFAAFPASQQTTAAPPPHQHTYVTTTFFIYLLLFTCLLIYIYIIISNIAALNGIKYKKKTLTFASNDLGGCAALRHGCFFFFPS